MQNAYTWKQGRFTLICPFGSEYPIHIRIGTNILLTLRNKKEVRQLYRLLDYELNCPRSSRHLIGIMEESRKQSFPNRS